MLIRIDASDARPLYEQIVLQLRAAIADGSLAGGDRLPPAKELAEAIGVNAHTVLHAYGELRDAGLIELRPRRGAVVVSPASPRAHLAELARRFTEQARDHGLTASEIIDLVAKQL
jgi:GntR family transcriptional regulator